MMIDPTGKICDDIENNQFYQFFLKEKGNDKPIATLTISDQIQKLSEGLELLQSELQSQVRTQHSALLSQASHAGNLDSALDSLNSNMNKILASANRLQNTVKSNFSLVEKQTKVLEKLYTTTDLLRSSAVLLQLTEKLRSSKDTHQQASLLYELEPLIADEELKKIEFIQDDRSYIIVTQQKLQKFAQDELLKGLKKSNAPQLINSLKIFINLQTVEKFVDNLIESYINDLTKTIEDCFSGTDISVPSTSSIDKEREVRRGPGKTPILTTSQHFRTKLWKSLKWFISEEVYEYCRQIIFLEECLHNINEISIINYDYSKNIFKKFALKVETLLRNSFNNCPAHISQSLKEGLPQLLSAARSLENKLSNVIQLNEDIFQSLEGGYLLKCGGNLKSTNSTIDSIEKVDTLIRAAVKELCAAMVDNRLAKMVAEVFNACNKDFWTKIEAQIVLGPDSKQVVDIPNAIQLQNIHLANIVFYHSESTKKLIENLGENFENSSAAESILKNLNYAYKLINTILNPIIESIKSTIAIILLSVHREPGLNSDKLSPVGPSLYMKELQDFLQRTWKLHIIPFNDKITTNKCADELASCCIQLFVNNVSILRPLSIAGRNRIKNDCYHLEIALKTIVPNISGLKKSFRLLRSISALITKTPEDLVKHDINDESPISSNLILFLLFAHAGSDLSFANWSNERLIQWLEEHPSEKERLELIAGALQKYRDTIRRKNTTQYDPVYPHLSSFFERSYKLL